MLDLTGDYDHRRNPDGSRQYEIKELESLHREIIRLNLLGIKQTVIAEQLNITPQTVSNTLNSTLAKVHMQELQGLRDKSSVDCQIELERLVPEAIEIYKKVLANETLATVKDQISVAGEVLDRSGHVKVTKIQGEFKHAHLTGDDMREIVAQADRLRKQKEERLAAITVEAQPVPA